MDLSARPLPRATGSIYGRFACYGAASATGTLVDLTVFLGMLALGVWAGTSAALGYTAGTAWHWLISSRLVFADRLANRGVARGKQQALFVLSALLGLGLTTAIVAGGTATGFDPRLAKVAAMAASFVTVWTVRLLFVFRAKGRVAA